MEGSSTAIGIMYGLPLITKFVARPTGNSIRVNTFSIILNAVSSVRAGPESRETSSSERLENCEMRSILSFTVLSLNPLKLLGNGIFNPTPRTSQFITVSQSMCV